MTDKWSRVLGAEEASVVVAVAVAVAAAAAASAAPETRLIQHV